MLFSRINVYTNLLFSGKSYAIVFSLWAHRNRWWCVYSLECVFVSELMFKGGQTILCILDQWVFWFMVHSTYVQERQVRADCELRQLEICGQCTAHVCHPCFLQSKTLNPCTWSAFRSLKPYTLTQTWGWRYIDNSILIRFESVHEGNPC